MNIWSIFNFIFNFFNLKILAIFAEFFCKISWTYLYFFFFFLIPSFSHFLVEIFDKTCCPKKKNTEWVQKLYPSDLQMCLFVAKIIALNIIVYMAKIISSNLCSP